MTKIVIQTAGLSKSHGKNVALRILDLTIDRGEIFGQLGHNGTGRTTMVHLLTTLLAPARRSPSTPAAGRSFPRPAGHRTPAPQ